MRHIGSTWLYALAGMVPLLAFDSSAKPIDFDRQIRPILSDNCFACHGPDEKRRMAGLRLDIKDGGAYATKNGYSIIVPGDAANSRLFERLSTAIVAARMPPPNATTSPNKEAVELIRRWIEEGAKWEGHWAYVAPQAVAPPTIGGQAWVRNDIDRFILKRLRQEKLQPSAEADRATLLRRLTLDLTGLPPTPAELDAFLADGSPGAYERKVDALLASPRYGERMTMPWLDLARFADTHGYHIDSARDVSRWRDWVIRSFNENKPYDQFTIEQLAGDLLPNATEEQKIATGFNRNHMVNYEGGAIPEEYQNEYVIDRLEATSTTWMGTTMGCARCHDHKYDPITQKDFYKFYAFFNTVSEKGLDGRRGNAAPLLSLPSEEQSKRLAGITSELDSRKKALPEKELEALQERWEFSAMYRPPAEDRLLAHFDFDGTLPGRTRVLKGKPTFESGVIGKALELDGDTHIDFGNVGDFQRSDAFSIALWVRQGEVPALDILQKTDTSPTRRGYQLSFDEGVTIGSLQRGAKLSFRMIGVWPDNAIEIQTKRRLMTKGESEGRPWYQVTVLSDGSGKASGVQLYINGRLEPVDILKDRLAGSIRTSGSLRTGSKEQGHPFRGRLDDLRLYGRLLSAVEIEDLAIRQPARAILAVPVADRTKEQKVALRNFFLTYEVSEPYRANYTALQSLKAEKERLLAAIPTTMVMAEMETPRETAVLGRGDYRNRGTIVTADTPSMLPPLPKDAPRNRLTLARWLVDPANPLTARVAVNRYWQMYFGTGLVKTVEDFGSQGEAPSHPELLDWLATEFVRGGWDIKAMQKLIVMSATYRQSSKITPNLLEKDPANRLLARGPRFRLPAESIRDNALFIGGLLKERIGGPSVFPYQPKGLWEDVAYGDFFSAQTYSPSHGDDLYRRSMYTFWKRTSGPPSLLTFDAPDREKCSAQRTPTNTPLQALVLLNDDTYLEAARFVAERMLKETGPAERIQWAFRFATAREADTRELQILRDLAERQLAVYRRDRGAALQLLQVGEKPYNRQLDASELAAWTIVASTILNLDETITKD